MTCAQNDRLILSKGWLVQNCFLVPQDGAAVSTRAFVPREWLPSSVPSTVLNALVRNGVYPDPRIGLNNFLIPDASDRFNQTHDLKRYSHLPDRRNPWRDPYWYRTEFELPKVRIHERTWLVFNGINYRADVWLNGALIADHERVVGAFSRYRFDITDLIDPDNKNVLAVKIYPVDHPGEPDAQLDVFGEPREYHRENLKDVGLVMSIGYDCMPTVRDRNMGIWQDVLLEFTGPVALRDPFVVTHLPLPKTDRAFLTVFSELSNHGNSSINGLFKGSLLETGMTFAREIELAANSTEEITLAADEYPQLTMEHPRLWWPNGYGPQNLYHLLLSFECNGQICDRRLVRFGVREITKVLHELDGEHGLQLHINGRRVFCRGGYIQPEILFSWDKQRIETELRYLSSANFNLLYFEDVPNPPDWFADTCDELGLMYANCYYGCWWMTPESGYPEDVDLLSRGTADIIKRYRNHSSLIFHMAMNEGDTRPDVYEMWRRHVTRLDGTRLIIPSGSYPDYRENPPEWVLPDMPVGMNDWVRGKSYGWQPPAQYFRWVREERGWMFQMECGSASLPPVDSLRKFMPDLFESHGRPNFPLTKTWAHHGANSYYAPYDSAIRRIFGEPESVEDYCAKAHLITADQHRAMLEAVNHRMWDITSGFTQWKVNACWPSIQWQVYDWFLTPMVSYYYIRKACAPLSIQMDPIDFVVAVINNTLESREDFRVSARVFDMDMNLRWERTATADIKPDGCRNIFALDSISDLTDIYFVKLQLEDQSNRLIADNFYWLCQSKGADFRALAHLPRVDLDMSCHFESRPGRKVAHVVLKNPTKRLAFFIHAAAVKDRAGEQLLPVFWDDNYFSLLPGQSRELRAELYDVENDEEDPVIEVGGWNIQTDYECVRIDTAKKELLSNEEFTVVATIQNTFIDGSLVDLLVDNVSVVTQRIYARRESRDVAFNLKLSHPGSHTISVADQAVTVRVS